MSTLDSTTYADTDSDLFLLKRFREDGGQEAFAGGVRRYAAAGFSTSGRHFWNSPCSLSTPFTVASIFAIEACIVSIRLWVSRLPSSIFAISCAMGSSLFVGAIAPAFDLGKYL